MSDAPRPEDAGDRLEEVLAEHREEDGPAEATEEAPYDPFAPPAGTDPLEPEADGLPQAPLFALLRRLETDITPARIDRLWVFPPRRIEAGETSVVVVAAFMESDADRRRIFAAHYTALDDSDEHRLVVLEYGTAPPDRVGRLVEEAVERIKEGPTAAPRHVRVDGDEGRWHETLHQLAEAWLEDRQRDRRIRG